jgi:hypothetical protein
MCNVLVFQVCDADAWQRQRVKKTDDDDAEGENCEVKFESEALDLGGSKVVIGKRIEGYH